MQVFFFMEDTRVAVLNAFSICSIKVCRGSFTQEFSLKYFVRLVKSGSTLVLCGTSRSTEPTISPYKLCIRYAKIWCLFFPAVSGDSVAQDLNPHPKVTIMMIAEL